MTRIYSSRYHVQRQLAGLPLKPTRRLNRPSLARQLIKIFFTCILLLVILVPFFTLFVSNRHELPSENDHLTVAVAAPLKQTLAVNSNSNSNKKADISTTDIAAETIPKACDPHAEVIKDHNTLLTERPCQPITVAYAVSLIKCGDFQSTPEGLVDAALVMRHSIHQTSWRAGASHYDYKMYAIVHEDAVKCGSILTDAGFEVLVRNRPVEKSEIRGDFLRSKIEREWCCGHDEFIKLYAYTLPEPLVVHVDMDFVFSKPMDSVYDALLFAPDSDIGKAARQNVVRQRSDDPWPERPQAMMARDWGQVYPGRKAGYQAGFIVLRSNPQVMQDLVDIVKEGHYVEGFSPHNGWGAEGYGAFVGAMAMQGLLAYYYDIRAPDSWVELNGCRYNHMGMDVRFNPGGPGFQSKRDLVGKCRNNQETCEDCMRTSIHEIHNIHYTQCRKPWMCIGEGDSSLPLELRQKPKKKTRFQKNLIPEENVHLDHCMELLTVWHNHRFNLEQQLETLVKDNTGDKGAIDRGTAGSYKTEFFRGHCAANGEYLTLASGETAVLKRIPQLYHDNDAATRI